ncbi:4Fe-4S dicluster domain-containing protein [Thermincola potens]|uniref:4Fe-4S ferredoxin iron-sulfur binding domain protein n=1 Tax=Thermincola potens (strain JR) TaxID=635013 RepID=D5XCF6_THEPJ|nr:4Fe-4S dicluster domain-containing protein [Thermincola potens]ADG81582.1 4Fe-4S ferredoxin iron-sulfur binding domain protein [Thermincola potens JR]
MKRIYANEEVCIGCRLCEVHCIVAHSRYPNDIVKAYKKGPRPAARIIVEENKPVSFAIQCRHCDEPYCIKACITGAMHRDTETGTVVNDTERCVGCWTCIVACPFGAIVRDGAGKKVAAKCDLCIEKADGRPACVANCPNGALVLAE